MDGIFYKKMKLYFQTTNFQKNAFLLTTSLLLAMECYFAYPAKGIDILYKNIVVFEKNNC